MTTEELTALPKVELHCHLDGSLSRGFIETGKCMLCRDPFCSASVRDSGHELQ